MPAFENCLDVTPVASVMFDRDLESFFNPFRRVEIFGFAQGFRQQGGYRADVLFV